MHKNARSALNFALLGTCLATAACTVPMALGAGATAGYVGLQDRSVRQTASDTKIKVAIKASLADAGFQYLANVGIDVFYGHVVLTGVLPSQADGDLALRIVQGVSGVVRVHNELFIGAVYSTRQKAKDAWISAQIQPRLLGDGRTYPLNYLISVANNHVYVSGSADSEAERDHVLHVVGTVPGVVRVHDYMVIVGQQAADRPYIPPARNPA